MMLKDQDIMTIGMIMIMTIIIPYNTLLTLSMDLTGYLSDGSAEMSLAAEDDLNVTTPRLLGSPCSSMMSDSSAATPALPDEASDGPSLPQAIMSDSAESQCQDAEVRVLQPHEVRSMLKNTNDDSSFRRMGMEWYSVPRVLSGGRQPALSFDILNGWDFDLPVNKTLSMTLLKQKEIAYLFLSPPCTMFSELQRLFNYHRMDPEVFHRRMLQAKGYIKHSMEGAKVQVRRKRWFAYEHPWKASSWSLEDVEAVSHLPGVSKVTFDMCACGMVSLMGTPVKKRTTIMTNDEALVARLQDRQCSQDHVHRAIEGSELGHSMSRWCQTYPPGLVNVLAEALQNRR